MSEQSTIHMILRKKERWGRPLFYPVNKKDVWITTIQGQTSLTEHDVKYLKNTLQIFIQAVTLIIIITLYYHDS